MRIQHLTPGTERDCDDATLRAVIDCASDVATWRNRMLEGYWAWQTRETDPAKFQGWLIDRFEEVIGLREDPAIATIIEELCRGHATESIDYDRAVWLVTELSATMTDRAAIARNELLNRSTA